MPIPIPNLIPIANPNPNLYPGVHHLPNTTNWETKRIEQASSNPQATRDKFANR